MIGIYRIVSPTKKVYIGQSWDISTRWRDYKYISKSQRKLYYSFQKYGIEFHVFEIIQEFSQNCTQEHLDYAEKFFWRLEVLQGSKMLNIKEPGKGGKLPEETRKRLSIALKGKISWNKGIKLGSMSDEHKEKISKKLKGKMTKNIEFLHSPEIRKKAAKTMMGKKWSNDRKKNHSEILKKSPNMGKGGKKNKGKIRSQENKDKISITLKNRKDNKGELHNMVVLTEKQVLEIRDKYKPREYSSRKLAIEYKVSKTNILDIVHKRIWNNI